MLSIQKYLLEILHAVAIELLFAFQLLLHEVFHQRFVRHRRIPTNR